MPASLTGFSSNMQPLTLHFHECRRTILQRLKRKLLSKGFIKLVRLNHERHVIRLQDEHDDMLDEVCSVCKCSPSFHSARTDI